MSSIKVTPDSKNTVSVSEEKKQISIENPTTHNTINISTGETKIVNVTALGPQGPEGRIGQIDEGEDISINSITASANISASGTGSFSEGRFTGFVGIGNGTSALNPEAILHLQNTQDDKYLQRWTLNNIEGGIFGDSSGDVLKIQVNSRW